MECELDCSTRPEQEINPEWSLTIGDMNLRGTHAGARLEVALLIELAVVRQVGLGDGAEDCPAMDDNSRVEERACVPEWCANDQHGKQIARCDDELFDGAFN